MAGAAVPELQTISAVPHLKRNQAARRIAYINSRERGRVRAKYKGWTQEFPRTRGNSPPSSHRRFPSRRFPRTRGDRPKARFDADSSTQVPPAQVSGRAHLRVRVRLRRNLLSCSGPTATGTQRPFRIDGDVGKVPHRRLRRRARPRANSQHGGNHSERTSAAALIRRA